MPFFHKNLNPDKACQYNCRKVRECQLNKKWLISIVYKIKIASSLIVDDGTTKDYIGMASDTFRDSEGVNKVSQR